MMKLLSQVAIAVALFATLAGHAVAQLAPRALNEGTVSFQSPRSTSAILLQFLGGAPMPEGTAWDSSEAVILHDKSEEIEIRLPSEVKIAAAVLQADNNDSYFLEAASPSGAWETIWIVPKVTGGNGLRSRAVRLSTVASRLRIRPGSGDGSFSVSRLLLFEEPYASEAEKYELTNRTSFLFNITPIPKKLIAIAAIVAGMFALYAGSAVARRRGFIVIGILGLLAMPLWWNIGTAHNGIYIHHWDFGHYYLGAKYFDELGYSRLYTCALQADLEAGAVRLEDRPVIRDLSSNDLRQVRDLSEPPSQCRSYFTDVRWRDFAADVAWLRERLPPQRWELFKRDHGFNGSPVWTILGGTVANAVPLTEQNALYLQGIDWALLILMWVVLWWGFGWRGAAFAAIYWGTNTMAPYLWTGSSFLRHDWLFALAGSAAFLKRGFPATGGALLAYSALLRIFPILVLIPWLLIKGRELLVERKFTLSHAERRCLIGGLSTVLLLCGIAAARTNHGLSAFSDYGANLEKHRATPLTNCAGVPFLLSFTFEGRAHQIEDPRADDPFLGWKEHQLETLRSRRILYWALLLLYAASFLVRKTRLELWETLCLGVTAIPLFTSLTFYYYGFLLLLGVLYGRARSAAIGILVFSLFTQEVEIWFPGYDDQGAIYSMGILLLILTTVLAMTASNGREASLKES